MLVLKNKYPGRVDIPPTAPEWPNGAPKNDVIPGDKTGMPGERGWVRDLWALLETLLRRSNITPNGLEDTPLGSQPYDALETLFTKALFSETFNYVLSSSDVTESVFGDVITFRNVDGSFRDRDDNIVNFVNGDRIKVIGLDATLTRDLDFGGADNLTIITVPTFLIPLGDQGSNIPYNIITAGDRVNSIFFTDQDYEEVISAGGTLTQQRVVKNRGLGSRVWLNNRQIFGRNKFDIFNFKYRDPYNIELNGQILAGGQEEFKDLFKLLGFSQTPSMFHATNFYVSDLRGRGLRFGNSSVVAPDLHSRTGTISVNVWPGTGQPILGNVGAGTGLVTVNAGAYGTQANNVLMLNNLVGVRLTGMGIPGGSGNTSIIKSVNTTVPSATLISLVDSITGAVALTAGGNVPLTFIVSGDVGNSLEDDSLQQLTGSFNVRRTTGAGSILDGAAPTGVMSIVPGGLNFNSIDGDSGNQDNQIVNFTASGSPGSRVTTETRMINSLFYPYWLL
jgi:hypothetical protein